MIPVLFGVDCVPGPLYYGFPWRKFQNQHQEFPAIGCDKLVGCVGERRCSIRLKSHIAQHLLGQEILVDREIALVFGPPVFDVFHTVIVIAGGCDERQFGVEFSHGPGYSLPLRFAGLVA